MRQVQGGSAVLVTLDERPVQVTLGAFKAAVELHNLTGRQRHRHTMGTSVNVLLRHTPLKPNTGRGLDLRYLFSEASVGNTNHEPTIRALIHVHQTVR